MTGMFMGTPGYLAPEVHRSREDSGPASDVHSWGATVAYAGTGRPPYGTGTYEAIFFRLVHGQPDLQALPSSLRPLVTRALARDLCAPAVGRGTRLVGRDARPRSACAGAARHRAGRRRLAGSSASAWLRSGRIADHRRSSRLRQDRPTSTRPMPSGSPAPGGTQGIQMTCATCCRRCATAARPRPCRAWVTWRRLAMPPNGGAPMGGCNGAYGAGNGARHGAGLANGSRPPATRRRPRASEARRLAARLSPAARPALEPGAGQVALRRPGRSGAEPGPGRSPSRTSVASSARQPESEPGPGSESGPGRPAGTPRRSRRGARWSSPRC